MNNIYKSIKDTKWFAYLMISFAAILFNFGIQVFVQVGRTFSSGVSSLVLVPSFLYPSLIPFVPLMYLGLNVPLIIIFWNKIRRSFIIRTIVFLLVQSAFGILFLNDNISTSIRSLIVPYDEVLEQVWPIFILSMIGGVFIGFSAAISWKFGGSSGGGDFITYYLSTKKKVPVGTVSFIISMMFLSFAFFLSIGLDPTIRTKSIPIIISTILYVFIMSIVINFVYPKYSKIKVEIHSLETEKINSMLKKEYHHAWSIEEIESGYIGQKRKKITTVMLLLELKQFKQKILEIDPSSWISISTVKKVIGEFDTSQIEDM